MRHVVVLGTWAGLVYYFKKEHTSSLLEKLL